MADTVSMARSELLRKADADPNLDTLREGVRLLTQALMELEVERFRQRTLEGPYSYVWVDATFIKARRDQRVVNVAVVIAVGLNTATGQREVLGVDVGPSEDGAFWLRFLRSLVARGLTGVQLVTSDSHQGLHTPRTLPSPRPW